MLQRDGGETTMRKELSKVYDPHEVEGRIYQQWEENKCFAGVRDAKKKPYTIVMPPPNVTGQLHMGHAMDCTLQDILIRFKRMQGYAALWVPGTDHAGIATQIKVEEELRVKEGLTRYDLGREKFLERVWDWKAMYGDRIVAQQKKMGASCDWDRARFTMDEGCSKAVRETFCELYEKGLIYKGSRIINWCPHCVTALSDAEVEYVDKPGHLWHMRYPLSDGSGYLVVATTRPETMMGDTGVAVNPNDTRYQHLVGKTCLLPLMNREIPIVADEYVEMDFGTGCVKMTPAHDPNDFEVGLRHNLDTIRVLDDNGVVNANGGKYEGMDRYAARKAVVADMEALGLMEKVEDYSHNVGTCYRCHNDVEPIISAQWFVKMAPLAKEAIRVVEEGETKFVPDRFSKTYLNWMENVHDWCISRQLWWGHQIPVWYCDDCGHMTVSRTDPTVCAQCGSAHIQRDPDVLDTWFSSALWPFSTLGWPDNTEDLKYFYPTDVLVTGYDIITFWVSRMITCGVEEMGETPFKTVLIHGLVRDELGRKMSKSLGNGVDPLEIIDEYGADALRFSLSMGVSPGNDTRFSKEKVESARNFANKVWNASRFVLMNVDTRRPVDLNQLTLADQWILTRFQDAVRDITAHNEEGDFGLSATRIYDFAWSEFCDWYIELAKSRLTGEDEAAKHSVQAVLLYVLEGLLKLLHPFMPFLTEQVYKYLPGTEGFLMLAPWPECKSEYDFPAQEREMEGIMEVIRTIRNLRAEMNVAASRRTRLMLLPGEGWQQALAEGEPYFKRLAGASESQLIESRDAVTEKTVSAVCLAGELFIPLGDLVDFEKEIARLNKELATVEKEIERAKGKLSNQGFLSKAPAQLVEAEKEKLEANEKKAVSLNERIAELKQSL